MILSDFGKLSPVHVCHELDDKLTLEQILTQLSVTETDISLLNEFLESRRNNSVLPRRYENNQVLLNLDKKLDIPAVVFLTNRDDTYKYGEYYERLYKNVETSLPIPRLNLYSLIQNNHFNCFKICYERLEDTQLNNYSYFSVLKPDETDFFTNTNNPDIRNILKKTLKFDYFDCNDNDEFDAFHPIIQVNRPKFLRQNVYNAICYYNRAPFLNYLLQKEQDKLLTNSECIYYLAKKDSVECLELCLNFFSDAVDSASQSNALLESNSQMRTFIPGFLYQFGVYNAVKCFKLLLQGNNDISLNNKFNQTTDTYILTGICLSNNLDFIKEQIEKYDREFLVKHIPSILRDILFRYSAFRYKIVVEYLWNNFPVDFNDVYGPDFLYDILKHVRPSDNENIDFVIFLLEKGFVLDDWCKDYIQQNRILKLKKYIILS
jgi:hypothetical protein